METLQDYPQLVKMPSTLRIHDKHEELRDGFIVLLGKSQQRYPAVGMEQLCRVLVTKTPSLDSFWCYKSGFRIDSPSYTMRVVYLSVMTFIA